MSEPMTAEELAAIAAREAKATPGPWRPYNGWTFLADAVDHSQDRMAFERIGPETPHGAGISAGDGRDMYASRADAEFVAMAREDIPALLAEVARLEAFRNRVLRAFAGHVIQCVCEGIIHDPDCPFGELEVEADEIWRGDDRGHGRTGAMSGKTQISCETCGAAVLRDEDNTLKHQWYFQGRDDEWWRGTMVGYRCPNAGDVASHINSWGKIRTLARRVSEDVVPVAYR